MIAPKVPATTKADERNAYALATLRDRDQCVRCRRGNWPERDHRKNRSQGGRTVVENLSILCSECHLWKTTHPAAALEQGYAVPGWADPAEFPAARWFADGPVLRLGWCLYRADGTVDEISEAEALARMEGLW